MEDLSRYNPEGSTLRKAQLRMLDMLVEIDKLCRKYDIPYWLEFGTLLGAVRHKGFIPWDDDVDIAILQSDYDRLREILIKELPEKFVFQDAQTDKYAFTDYGRVRDRQSYCYHPHFTKLQEQGLWVDIFRYSLVNNLESQQVVDFVYRRVYREIHNYGAVAYSSKIRAFAVKSIAFVIYPLAWIMKSTVECLGKHSKHPKLMRWSCPPRMFEPNKLFPLVEVEFEGHMFNAPGNWHEHLTDIYGDYMQIPPEEKREQILDMNKVQIFE